MKTVKETPYTLRAKAEFNVEHLTTTSSAIVALVLLRAEQLKWRDRATISHAVSVVETGGQRPEELFKHKLYRSAFERLLTIEDPAVIWLQDVWQIN